MFRLAGVSASARPLVTSGIAEAIPPVPVLVPTPAPVRLNQVSSVNWGAPSEAACPIVTYWLEPLNWSALLLACGVAAASFDACDSASEASTAVTT